MARAKTPDTDAPDTGAPETPAPLGALSRTETVAKAARVFRTIKLADGKSASALDPDDPGRVYAIQREVRADGTEGPLMLAVVVSRKQRGGEVTENASRVSLADIEGARSALLSEGVRVFAAE